MKTVNDMEMKIIVGYLDEPTVIHELKILDKTVDCNKFTKLRGNESKH